MENKTDKDMMAKGYKYKIRIDTDAIVDTFYAKSLMGIGPIFRDYPGKNFIVEHMESGETQFYNGKKSND